MATRAQLVRSYTIYTEIDQEVTQVRFGFGGDHSQQAVQSFLESIPVATLRKYHRHKCGYSGKAGKAQLVNNLLRVIFRSKYVPN